MMGKKVEKKRCQHHRKEAVEGERSILFQTKADFLKILPESLNEAFINQGISEIS